MKTKKTEPQVRWYHSETEDFVGNKNQDLKIPEDYVWVRTGRWDRIKASFIFHLARFLGGLYMRLFLHVRVESRFDNRLRLSGMMLIINTILQQSEEKK